MQGFGQDLGIRMFGICFFFLDSEGVFGFSMGMLIIWKTWFPFMCSFSLLRVTWYRKEIKRPTLVERFPTLPTSGFLSIRLQDHGLFVLLDPLRALNPI